MHFAIVNNFYDTTHSLKESWPKPINKPIKQWQKNQYFSITDSTKRQSLQSSTLTFFIYKVTNQNNSLIQAAELHKTKNKKT